MTTTSKRLDKIEQNLTAKELAIRFANEITQFKSADEYFRAFDKSSSSMEKVLGPWDLIDKQVEAKISGKTNDAARERKHAYESMVIEFKTLQNMIFNINAEIDQRIEKASLEAALYIKSLQTLILQDSFSQTARDAARWIKNVKTEGIDSKGSPKILLKELETCYFDHHREERDADAQVNPNGINELLGSAFSLQMEDWVFKVKSMIFDLYSHQRAIQFIQDEYLNGHPFLFQGTENRMNFIIKLIQETINKYTHYLSVRKKMFSAKGKNANKTYKDLQIKFESLNPTHDDVRDLINIWIKNAKLETLSIVKGSKINSWNELKKIMGSSV